MINYPIYIYFLSSNTQPSEVNFNEIVDDEQLYEPTVNYTEIRSVVPEFITGGGGGAYAIAGQPINWRGSD